MKKPNGKDESVWKFIARVERGHRIRLQHLMWELCDENHGLGGKVWKKVLRRYKLKETDLWKSNP